ncbi:MAG: indolepyruvate ferredoxin oxidoreductase family protein [Alphaproteobacteria bacterium]|nr:indolepyruvate ferredoxin oxidoreductase family protein [Alphaproteobacteria bacterium]
MALAAVSLDDKYALESGRVYLSGVQALVRLSLMQRRRDLAAGLNTAGFISGYRGSPLGGYDTALWQAREFLEKHAIHFRPGVNEDLGATAVWGSQQVNLFEGARYDGVFGIWYGKGPGVDRSGDVFKHANAAGTSQHGGVLALLGDDHACKSSTLPHQSEFACIDANIPVLNPANVQDVLDFGLIGWAMSRYSGCWIALKAISETMDSSAACDVAPDRVRIRLPEDFDMPEGGLNIRRPDSPMAQEARLHRHKLFAARAFAHANGVDRILLDSPSPRFGILTTGKATNDVRQALRDLGIDETEASRIGLRVLKIGLSWPMDPAIVRRFAEGLEEVLVVEEKRAVLENQLKEQLYNLPADTRPRIVGKRDERGNWLVPSEGELSPAQTARAIAARLEQFYTSPTIQKRLAFLEAKEKALTKPRGIINRVAYFCSGCPHNSSTRVPEGSRAMAGIGCHYMVQWMDRATDTFTHMGGEGVNWIGQAPFTETPHIFQNIGDGTYFHSGILAIRAAVAANVNITYKILYNDAVAMTGGQPVDGPLSVSQITHQLYGEGVRHILVVTDEPDKYPRDVDFASGVTVHHRDAMDRLQRDLRKVKGVSVLIYDQVCAAEKRRRRKRGLMEDPPLRVFINPDVCEGCGDCGKKSNCLSIVALETEFGRKRAIDQSSCNKDYSCLNGFCPSFVTVEGGKPRKRSPKTLEGLPTLPEPALPSTADPYNIVIAGAGGTGVVTISNLLGMAAHLEGKRVTVLDQTGLAQKGGAVWSHVRILDRPAELYAVRIPAGRARLLLGCDLVVAASFESLAKTGPETAAVVNSHETMTGDFTRSPDMTFPERAMETAIREATDGNATFLDASRLATRLMGDSIATNLFLLGHAYQKGLIPLSGEAITRAIELNGVAVTANLNTFRWGRLSAINPALVRRAGGLAEEETEESPSLDARIARRRDFLTAYQNARLAERYAALVRRAKEAEAAIDRAGLAEAVARAYFKLLAYKDEYEVARLFTNGDFDRRLNDEFEGDFQIAFHLAPPLLARPHPETGEPKKIRFGPWMKTVFRFLAPLRFLRGTPFDPFGHSADRKRERWLIAEYERALDELLAGLKPENHALAVEIAALPLDIRGFGHVQEAAMLTAKRREAELLASFRNANLYVSAAE